jgi:hypothetical protein
MPSPVEAATMQAFVKRLRRRGLPETTPARVVILDDGHCRIAEFPSCVAALARDIGRALRAAYAAGTI